jgi:hypothetical protein
MAETKDKLDRLRAKRGGYRGVCTKLTKETEEIIHTDEIDYDRCEVIRSLLEEKSKILTDIDEEILGICEIASIEYEIEESADVMGRILSAKRKLDKVKLEAKKTGNTKASTVTIQHENGNIATTSSENSSEVTIHASNVTNHESGSESGGIINASNGPPEVGNMGEHGATESNQISVSSLKPKLPKLTLPKFKGQFTKWGPFWDS